MSKTVEQIISSFCDALKPGERYDPFISTAEAEGYTQLAKMFRAVVASEAARDRLLRQALPNHVDKNWDYYVCPYCGLIYEPDPPEVCLVDQTPASSFICIR
jgi:rubrerythrin